MISIIIDQYDQVQYCVLTPEGRTLYFGADQGLKQGDPMSPRLFNIFFMDIIMIFDQECDPLYINGMAIHVLLFADDLVVISAGHYGLQRALTKLSTYCMEWNLTVNTEKIKVMHVAHKDMGLETPPPLLYNGVTLEWVAGFNYLGVYIDTKGRLQPKTAPIALKAHRAQFKLSNMVRTLPFDTKMWLHQTMVDPIQLHGAEVWSCQDRGALIRRHGICHTFGDKGYKPLTGENIKRQYVRLQMGAPRHTPFMSLRGDSGVYPYISKGWLALLSTTTLSARTTRNHFWA